MANFFFCFKLESFFFCFKLELKANFLIVESMVLFPVTSLQLIDIMSLYHWSEVFIKFELASFSFDNNSPFQVVLYVPLCWNFYLSSKLYMLYKLKLSCNQHLVSQSTVFWLVYSDLPKSFAVAYVWQC